MEQHPNRFYEFGEFKLDSRRRTLSKKGEQLVISAKNFDLLFELIKNEGQILSHDSLLDKVWEGTFVEQSNLKKGISAIRQILGETPESSLYIKTIPRRGYCFVSPVNAFSDERTIDQIHVTATEIIIEEEIIEDDEPQRLVPATRPQLIGDQKQSKFNYAIPVSIGVLLMLIGGTGLWYFLRPKESTQFSSVNLETLKMQRLNTNGEVQESALSPDGKFFVYAVLDNDNKQSLWLRRIGAVNSLPLIGAAGVNYRSIDVSPENDSIFYGVSEGGKDVLYQIPILGGTPRKILEDISSSISFSPDNKKIAFARDKSGIGRSLIIYNLETGQIEKEVYTVTGDNHGLIAPKWSPDGTKFAFIVSEKLADGRTWALNEISVNGGAPRNITKPQKGKIYAFDWLSDTSGLIFSADLNDARQSQIFKVSYPGGETQRLTNDLLDYYGLSVGKDGKSILAVQEERKADLWSADFAKPNDSQQLTHNLVLPNRFAIFPDGNIIAEVYENGSQNLSIINGDGSNSQSFLQQPNSDRFPGISPDGKTVVFVSRRSGADQIWEADATGNNLRKLSDEKSFVANPRFSPDGNNIYFERYSETRFQLAKISKDGTQSSLVSDDATNNFDLSPDGKFVAYGFFDAQNKKWKISVRNLTDNSLVKTFDAAASNFVRFTPDGKSIIYNISDIFRDGGNVWVQPLDGSPAKPLIELKNDKVYWANFSPDGKKLFYTRGRTNSSAVLLSTETAK
jgi:Tol biopolymer transport system component/DNA-binding winged helix-turn-helix (wHTH) protein